MIEIKYRVWCEFMINGKIYKEMAGPESWFLLEQNGNLLSHNSRGILDNPSTKYIKTIPLFYTGTHDRNGKEIFEGDILQSGLNNFEIIDFGFLRENDDEVMENISGWFVENLYTGKKRTLNKLYISNYLIIGNKFENEELLNKR